METSDRTKPSLLLEYTMAEYGDKRARSGALQRQKLQTMQQQSHLTKHHKY